MFKKLTVRELTMISLFTALICVSSYIKIDMPIGVPLTAQTLAVMLAGSILSPRQAAFSLLTYLLLGIIGAPVFAGGYAGLSIIFGKSGGYLLGFLLGAVTIALLKGQNNSITRLGVANIIGGILVVNALGVLWLSAMTGMSLSSALIAGVLPYIPGDLLKAAIATVMGVKLNKHLRYTDQRA